MLDRFPDYLLYRILIQLNQGVDGLFILGSLCRSLNHRLLNTQIFQDYQTKWLNFAQQKTENSLNNSDHPLGGKIVGTNHKYRLSLVLDPIFKQKSAIIITHPVESSFDGCKFDIRLENSPSDLRLKSFLNQLCRQNKIDNLEESHRFFFFPSVNSEIYGENYQKLDKIEPFAIKKARFGFLFPPNDTSNLKEDIYQTECEYCEHSLLEREGFYQPNCCQCSPPRLSFIRQVTDQAVGFRFFQAKIYDL